MNALRATLGNELASIVVDQTGRERQRANLQATLLKVIGRGRAARMH